MNPFRRFHPAFPLWCGAIVLLAAFGTVGQGPVFAAEPFAYRQAIEDVSPKDSAISAFYEARDFAPLWTGGANRARRVALARALAGAQAHGLPVERYDLSDLRLGLGRTQRDRGEAELAMSRAFLAYARDVASGVLSPSDVTPDMVRKVARPDPLALLNAFAQSDPDAFLQSLPPQSPDYQRLMAEKLRLERVIAEGGWGPMIEADRLEIGATGPGVVALRDRLMAMSYLGRSSSGQFDAEMLAAVQAFQRDHGLLDDGIVGPGTLGEINRSAEDRLKSVVVAMERLRWLPRELGTRHVWVNQADFTAKIVDSGQVTFETRTVIGRNVDDQRSPEFSDQMEFMVINPSWYVPRSITVAEYLPKLQEDPTAVSFLNVIDDEGREIPRETLNFTEFTAKTFPYSLKQGPSEENALGLVKFMFPNPWNIYLHDTPQKSLFARETRAFSHGCIRLAEPFEFAYALLARQESDPVAAFAKVLNAGAEATVMLQQPVPVHLVYATAFVPAKGRANFRRDVYGRDALIWQALQSAGVELPVVQS